MSLLMVLKKKKEELEVMLALREAIVARYAIRGTITEKKINGKVYEYLQYVNDCGQMISVYLDEQTKTAYNRAAEKKLRIQRRINQLKEDLGLLVAVPTQSTDRSPKLPDRHCRLLSGAVGISGERHVLFQIGPLKEKGFYEAVGRYKKKTYRVPLTYVDETKLDWIALYINAAGMAMDVAIAKAQNPKTLRGPKVLYGRTEHGNQYVAKFDGSAYVIQSKSLEKADGLICRIEQGESKWGDALYRTMIEYTLDQAVNEHLLSALERRNVHA